MRISAEIPLRLCTVQTPDPFYLGFHVFPPSEPPIHEPFFIHDPRDKEAIQMEGDIPINVAIEDTEDPRSSFFDAQDQVSLALDLFVQSPQRIDTFDRAFRVIPFSETVLGLNFGIFEENDEMGGSNLLELGFEMEFDAHDDAASVLYEAGSEEMMKDGKKWKIVLQYSYFLLNLIIKILLCIVGFSVLTCVF